MKLFLTTAALTATLISGMAFASDPVIPWATNSGGTESTHIAANGRGFECAASADHPHA
ncbi:putative secreted protein [Salmonella enterica subsp. enterica]|nr:putative secreted protein [Salmonella enterica subsp. enterica]